MKKAYCLSALIFLLIGQFAFVSSADARPKNRKGKARKSKSLKSKASKTKKSKSKKSKSKKAKAHHYCLKTTQAPTAFLTAEADKKTVRARGLFCSAWEVLTIRGTLKNKSKVTIQTHHGRYFNAQKNGALHANAKKGQHFTVYRVGKKNKKIRFKSRHGKYLVGDVGGLIKANRNGASTWETFELVKPPKRIDNLVTCIEKLPKKYHPLEVIATMHSFHGHPGKFSKSFHEKYVKDSLKSLNNWVKAEVLSEFKKTHPFDIEPGSRNWAGTLLDNVTSKVESLGSKRGMEPFGCLVKHVFKPLSATMKKHIVSTMVDLSKEMNSVWNTKVKGAIEAKVRDALNAQLKTLITGQKAADIQRILTFARQIALEQSVTNLKAVSGQMAAYEKHLKDGNLNQAKVVYKKLNGLLSGQLSTQQIARIAASAMERFVNQKISQWRAKHLDPILEKGLDVISSLLTAGEQNLTGYCGLIPEVGGIICSQFAVALHMTWDWVVRPTLLQKAKELFTRQTGAVVKVAKGMVMAQVRSSLDHKSVRNLERQYGSIAKTLNQFVGTFAGQLKTELAAANAYKTNMRTLLKRLDSATPSSQRQKKRHR